MGFHVYTLRGSGQQPERRPSKATDFRLPQFVLLTSSLKSRYCHLHKIAWTVGAALCNGLTANLLATIARGPVANEVPCQLDTALISLRFQTPKLQLKARW